MRWVALLVTLLITSEAHAYLADSYDGRVADHGTLELEIQPIGYYTADEEGRQDWLVTPSVILYLGFAERFDVLLASRGYLRIGGEGSSRYHTRESAAYLRCLLLEGTYNEIDGVEGPSFEVMAGALFPNLEQQDETIGASLGLVMTWSVDWGTIHANTFGNRTAWETWDAFFVVAYEGPLDWSVRPLIETWLDYDDGYVLASGLAGMYFDLSDTATGGLGIRHARGEGYNETEIRASLWWQLPPLWEPEG